MSYWCAARVDANRERLAIHCLGLAGFTTYFPHLREQRIVRGRKVEIHPALFPNYGFVLVVSGWWHARWCPGVQSLVSNGGREPARVPEAVIAGIRAREVNGLVELPKRNPRPGDPVRVICGPLSGLEGLYAGQAPHERVAILLTLLGSLQRVTLPENQIDVVISRTRRGWNE
jgi:transcription antitermination factor NusG